jgi:hypothetical protein
MTKFPVLAILALLAPSVACSSSPKIVGTADGGGEGGAVAGDGGIGPGLQTNPNGKPTGRECAGATAEAASTCQGLVCISLNDNLQGKKGICSAECTAKCESGPCIGLEGKAYCFVACTKDADCSDGFVCVGDGASAKVCLVVAKDGTTVEVDGGVNGTSRCLAAGCPSSTDPDDIDGACTNAPNSSEVCECTTTPPGAPCVAAAQGANLYCCP